MRTLPFLVILLLVLTGCPQPAPTPVPPTPSPAPTATPTATPAPTATPSPTPTPQPTSTPQPTPTQGPRWRRPRGPSPSRAWRSFPRRHYPPLRPRRGRSRQQQAGHCGVPDQPDAGTLCQGGRPAGADNQGAAHELRDRRAGRGLGRNRGAPNSCTGCWASSTRTCSSTISSCPCTRRVCWASSTRRGAAVRGEGYGGADSPGPPPYTHEYTHGLQQQHFDYPLQEGAAGGQLGRGAGVQGPHRGATPPSPRGCTWSTG